MHDRSLSLKDARNQQSNFVTELKNLGKGKKLLEKSFFK